MKVKYDVYKQKEFSWDDFFCSCCGNYLFSIFKKYGQVIGMRPWYSYEWKKCPYCNHYFSGNQPY